MDRHRAKEARSVVLCEQIVQKVFGIPLRGAVIIMSKRGRHHHSKFCESWNLYFSFTKSTSAHTLNAIWIYYETNFNQSGPIFRRGAYCWFADVGLKYFQLSIFQFFCSSSNCIVIIMNSLKKMCELYVLLYAQPIHGSKYFTKNIQYFNSEFSKGRFLLIRQLKNKKSALFRWSAVYLKWIM